MATLDTQVVEQRLKVRLRRPEFWWYALLNRSPDGQAPPASYTQRLLALRGDDAIRLAINEHLCDTQPGMEEYFSYWRSDAQKNLTFASFVRKCGVLEVVPASYNVVSWGAHKLGTVYEAVVGSILIDGDMPQVRLFIQDTIGDDLNQIIQNVWDRNPMLRLGTICQKVVKVSPRYLKEGEIAGPAGPLHVVRVVIRGRLSAIGTGRSHGEAKQAAALKALRELGLPDSKPPTQA